MVVAAPALIASFVNTANTLTTGPMPVASNVPAGAVLMGVVVGGGAVTLGISDSGGNTWTPLPVSQVATGAAATEQVFLTTVTTPLVAGVDTITATKSSTGGLVAHVYLLGGADSGAPLGNGGVTQAANNPNSEPITTPAVTPAAGDMVLMAAVAQDNRTLTSAGAGWNVAHDVAGTGAANNRRSLLVYQSAADATPRAPALDMSAGGAWAATTFVIAQEAAPPEGPTWHVKIGGEWVPMDAHTV